MSAVDGALRLRRIAAALREGRMPDADDATLLADGIDAYFGGRDLAAALDVAAPGRGREDGRRALLLEDRDEALELLQNDFGGEVDKGSDSECVWEIWETLQRFLPHYVGLSEKTCPAAWRGRKGEVLFRIIHGSSGRILSRRTIAEILKRANPISPQGDDFEFARSDGTTEIEHELR